MSWGHPLTAGPWTHVPASHGPSLGRSSNAGAAPAPAPPNPVLPLPPTPRWSCASCKRQLCMELSRNPLEEPIWSLKHSYSH